MAKDYTTKSKTYKTLLPIIIIGAAIMIFKVGLSFGAWLNIFLNY